MKEINIGGIKSISDARSSDKAARKEKAAESGKFQETLKTAQEQMVGAKGAEKSASNQVTTTNMKDEVTRLNDEYQQMMLAKQNLSKLYQIVQSNKPEDNNG